MPSTRQKQPKIELRFQHQIVLKKADASAQNRKLELFEIRLGGEEIQIQRPIELEEEIQNHIILLLNDILREKNIPTNLSSIYTYLCVGNMVYYSFDPMFSSQEREESRPVTPSLLARDYPTNDDKGGMSRRETPFDVAKRWINQIVNDEKEEKNKCNKYLDSFEYLENSGLIHTEIKLLRYEDNEDEWVLGFEFIVKFFRYFWGEFVKMLPTARLPHPQEAPKHGFLIGIGVGDWATKPGGSAEEALWNVLDRLNSIWRTNGNQVVFIQGEPGSGKEVVATAIHFGSVRGNSGDCGLKQRSVANMGTDDLRKLLFGYTVHGTHISGLIKQADQGTLFLDEFDKIVDEKFYAELLRVLESGEYVAVDGSEVLKVGDVNWIFAGAFTGEDLSNSVSDLPRDFWSRLTVHLSITNPIGEDSVEHDALTWSYAGALFVYFFMQEAAAFAGGVENMIENPTKDHRYYIAQQLIKFDSAMKKPGKEFLDMAQSFQHKINNGRYPLQDSCDTDKTNFYSVRCIRQAAKAAFSSLYPEFLIIRGHGKIASAATDFGSKDSESRAKAIEIAKEVVFMTRPGTPS